MVWKRSVTWNAPATRRTRGLARAVKTETVRAGASPAKVAPTLRAALIVNEQAVDEPLQSPLQPTKLVPGEGAAVSVTFELSVGVAVQPVLPLPQSIPLPLTVPGPVTVTVSRAPGFGVATAAKVAETLFGPVIESVHVGPLPVQAPLHPENVAPELAVAVNVTLEFSGWLALHVVAPPPQLTPPPVTEPGPLT